MPHGTIHQPKEEEWGILSSHVPLQSESSLEHVSHTQNYGVETVNQMPRNIPVSNAPPRPDEAFS